MNKRIALFLLATVFAVAALVDFADGLRAVRAAERTTQLFASSNAGATVVHDIYVRDVFGFPWWVMPLALGIVALVLFELARRVR